MLTELSSRHLPPWVLPPREWTSVASEWQMGLEPSESTASWSVGQMGLWPDLAEPTWVQNAAGPGQVPSPQLDSLQLPRLHVCKIIKSQPSHCKAWCSKPFLGTRFQGGKMLIKGFFVYTRK